MRIFAFWRHGLLILAFLTLSIFSNPFSATAAETKNTILDLVHTGFSFAAIVENGAQFKSTIPAFETTALAGDYRSVTTGNWNALSTWQRFDGTNWVAASVTPTSSNGGTITIQSPHTVTITTSVTYDQVVIDAGGQVTVAPGVSHVLNAGAGTDLVVNGTLLNQGATWTVSGATWSVGEGGTYIHNTTGSIAAPLDVASLAPGSNFIYRGSSTLQPSLSISNRTYSNLSFESTSGTYSTNFPSLNGPLTVNGLFNVGSNVNWTKGSYTGTLNINGDIAIAGSMTTTSITVGSAKSMTLLGTGTVTISSANTLTVNGTLSTADRVINGAGNFTLGQNARLDIGSSNGITTSPTVLGNIQNTGSRNFSSSAAYAYSGTAPQVSGNGLPATVGALIVNSPSGLTLSGPTSTSSLTLLSGLVTTTSNNVLTVTTPSPSAISGGSSTSYVKGPMRRVLPSGLTGGSIYTIPVGKERFTPLELVDPITSAGTVTIEAEVFDEATGGTAGAGLVAINSDRFWRASLTAGAGNFSSAKVRLTDPAVEDGSVIGRSAVVNGSYDSIEGTPAGLTVTSTPISEFGFFVIGTAPGPSTYVWAPAVGSIDWSSAANWNPVRLTPNARDTLIIDGAVTPAPIINNVGGALGETIRNLRIIGGASPMLLATGSPKTLNISGSAGAIEVGAGSNVHLSGASALTISIATGSGADVSGALIFDGPHRMIAAEPGAIVFNSGALATTTPNFRGYPFGDGTSGSVATGSVIFKSGSAYTHNAGDSLFGSSIDSAITIFESGSLAQWLTSEGFQASGRSYADLSVGNSGTAVALNTGGTGNFVFENLTVNHKTVGTAQNSSLTFSGSGSNSVTIRGNIRSIGEGENNLPDVQITPGSGGIVVSHPGGGTLIFESDGNNKPVLFGGPATVAGGTELNIGRIVQMGSGADHTLRINGNILSSSQDGYVIGPIKRSIIGGGSMQKSFPVGTVLGPSVIVADYIFPEAGTYEQTIKANPGPMSGISGFNKLQRSWTISGIVGPEASSADLTFNYSEADVVGTVAEYKFIRKAAGVFSIAEASGIPTATQASLSGVTEFSDWTLAEPAAIDAGSFELATPGIQVIEGGGNLVVTVSRTGGSDGAVSVQYATADQTAVAGQDYTAVSGALNWDAGDNAPKTFVVPIIDDAVFEGSETFSVTLSAPAGLAILGQQPVAEVTIIDNDLPSFTLTVSKSGNGAGTITSDRPGIDCGSDCVESYSAGTQITLTATSATGSHFAGWSGGGCTGAAACVVTIGEATSIVADFAITTVSGSVRFQNTMDRAVPVEERTVRGVSVSAVGSPSIFDISDPDGIYKLSGFGTGPYTVTPHKNDIHVDELNGIFADDAALVARYVVGLEPGLTAHQIAAAKVSGMQSVTSYDAALIAQWIVGIPLAANLTGKWRFTPVNAHYSQIAANVLHDFDALLIGDVNGDWNGAGPGSHRPQSNVPRVPVNVSIANTVGHNGSEILVPLTIEGITGASVTSYQFDITYDPAVVEPSALAVDLSGTMAHSLNVFHNVSTPGSLKIAAFGVGHASRDGVYANLRFRVISEPGSVSPLLISGFRLNDGSEVTEAHPGSIRIISTGEAILNGRVVTSKGSGVKGAQVILTSSDGRKMKVVSSSLGYFEFTGLTPGADYTVKALSRKYRFDPATFSTVESITSIELVGRE